MCFQEQGSTSKHVGRWAGQNMGSSWCSILAFHVELTTCFCSLFCLDHKAQWRIDAHKKHRRQLGQRYTESSLDTDLLGPMWTHLSSPSLGFDLEIIGSTSVFSFFGISTFSHAYKPKQSSLHSLVTPHSHSFTDLGSTYTSQRSASGYIGSLCGP